MLISNKEPLNSNYFSLLIKTKNQTSELYYDIDLNRDLEQIKIINEEPSSNRKQQDINLARLDNTFFEFRFYQ